MALHPLKIFCCLSLFCHFIQMLPIEDLSQGRFPEIIEKVVELGTEPKSVVKRSVFNGIQLLKTFAKNNSLYTCQISLTIGNLSYVNQNLSIIDDVSKLTVSNPRTNLNNFSRNGSLLVVQFIFNGTPTITLSYDFVSKDLEGTEIRNVTLFSNQSNSPILVEFGCLQRGNFNDYVASNSALIVLVFVAIIIVVVIFVILWCLCCRTRCYQAREDTQIGSNDNIYIVDSKLLIAESGKTYYERDTKSKVEVNLLAINEDNLFESDLSNARYFDEQLQQDVWKLDDTIFTIWLNSIVDQHPNLRDKANQISRQRIADRDNIKKTHQNAMAEKFESIKKEIIRKNNINLDHQKMTHDAERQRILAQVTDDDKEDVSSNLNKLFAQERRNVNNQLKIEQEEAFEITKLKCQAEMMSAIGENQIGSVKNLIKTSQLSPEESNEIMQRYLLWQQKLQGFGENEKIRQAAELAFLLENRINQTKKKEIKEEHTKELLKKKTNYFVNAISEFEENDDISQELSLKILSQFEHDKVLILNDIEKKKKDQVTALLERLNGEKQKKLEDLRVKQENEMNNLLTVHCPDSDARELIENLVHLKNHHRQERTSLEAETDVKNNEDLVNLLQEIGIQTMDKIDERVQDLTSELKYSGFSQDDIDDIIKDSNDRIKKLQKIQKQEREEQEKKLNERLRKIKKEIDDNANRQSKDQTNIIEAQFDVINDITNMQTTLSDAERNNILELFEKNKSLMETNLANSCILQRRKMDDILNAKKEKKERDLEESHSERIKEIYEKVSKRKSQDNIDQAVSKCVSDFVAAKLNTSDQEDSQKELDKEMERIRKEILEERVLLIHRKEEEIAALLNKFQLAKATQHIELKEQQEKLNELKMVVLDSMDREKSVSNVIAKHNRDKEVLADSIDMNKRRQEDELQRRLMKKKRKSLFPDEIDRGDVEVSENATQIKKQNLKDSILQNNLKSENEIKLLETEFLKTIIMEAGDFPRSELLTVLRQMFPLKTNQEIEIMAEEIYPKSKEKAQTKKSLMKSYKKITETNKSGNQRPISAISQRSGRQKPPLLEDPSSETRRPGTAKKAGSRESMIPMSYDSNMNDMEPTSEEIPAISKPKKKRKKRRDRGENIEEDDA